METTGIDKDLHVTFAQMMYHLLPNPYESQEINHLTLAYFVISSLDILNALHLVYIYISTLLFSFVHFFMIKTKVLKNGPLPRKRPRQKGIGSGRYRFYIVNKNHDETPLRPRRNTVKAAKICCS